MTDAARHLATVRQHYPDAVTTVAAVDRQFDLRSGVTEDLLPAYRD